MSFRAFAKTLGSLLVAVALTGTLGVVASAQDVPVIVEGRIEWIAGETMVIAPDGLVVAPGGTTAINIDLTRIGQGAYAGLATGVRVAVMGTIAGGYNRVIAESIERLSP